MKLFKHQDSRGDTIVEVLIAIAVIGAILSGAYALASRSLKTGITANIRTEALAISQSQVELLKAELQRDPTTFASTYKVSGPFCISVEGKKTGAGCTNYQLANTESATQYQVAVTFDSARQIFTITTTWDSLNGGGTDQQTLYYKLPSTFAASPAPSPTPTPTPPPPGPGPTPPPPPPGPPPSPTPQPPSGCYLTGTAGGDFSASVIGYDCSFGDRPVNYSFSYTYTWTDGGGNTCTGGGSGGAWSITNPSGSIGVTFTMRTSNVAGNGPTLTWSSGMRGVGGGVAC